MATKLGPVQYQTLAIGLLWSKQSQQATYSCQTRQQKTAYESAGTVTRQGN